MIRGRKALQFRRAPSRSGRHRETAMTTGDSRSQLLAIALLALSVVLLLGFATAPFVQLPGLNNQLTESRALLAGLQRQIARQSATPSGSASDPAGLLLSGGTTGIAAANL